MLFHDPLGRPGQQPIPPSLAPTLPYIPQGVPTLQGTSTDLRAANPWHELWGSTGSVQVCPFCAFVSAQHVPVALAETVALHALPAVQAPLSMVYVHL